MRDTLEEKCLWDILPCIDDVYIETHHAEWSEAEKDLDNSYVSLEEIIQNYKGKKNL